MTSKLIHSLVQETQQMILFLSQHASVVAVARSQSSQSPSTPSSASPQSLQDLIQTAEKLSLLVKQLPQCLLPSQLSVLLTVLNMLGPQLHRFTLSTAHLPGVQESVLCGCQHVLCSVTHILLLISVVTDRTTLKRRSAGERRTNEESINLSLRLKRFVSSLILFLDRIQPSPPPYWTGPRPSTSTAAIADAVNSPDPVMDPVDQPSASAPPLLPDTVAQLLVIQPETVLSPPYPSILQRLLLLNRLSSSISSSSSLSAADSVIQSSTTAIPQPYQVRPITPSTPPTSSLSVQGWIHVGHVHVTDPSARAHIQLKRVRWKKRHVSVLNGELSVWKQQKRLGRKSLVRFSRMFFCYLQLCSFN